MGSFLDVVWVVQALQKPLGGFPIHVRLVFRVAIGVVTYLDNQCLAVFLRWKLFFLFSWQHTKALVSEFRAKCIDRFYFIIVKASVLGVMWHTLKLFKGEVKERKRQRNKYTVTTITTQANPNHNPPRNCSNVPTVLPSHFPRNAPDLFPMSYFNTGYVPSLIIHLTLIPLNWIQDSHSP